MAVFTVLSENVSTHYKTTLCSKSTLFIIITTFLTLMLPLLIAYRSHSFWFKTLSYREQPFVRYKQEYFLYLELVGHDEEPIVCTTIRKKTEFLESLDKCTSVLFHEEDINGDGKYDTLSMEIIVSHAEDISVQSLYLVLAFNYVLQHQCLVEMEGLAVVQSETASGGSQLDVLGDLQLLQRTLLPCRGRHLIYNQSAFSDPHVNIQQLVRNHALQNVSTRFQNEVIHWTRGSDRSFGIHVDVMYPEVTVKYRPGFWPVMKWAWIQYLAILVIFLAAHRFIKRYVFLTRLLPTIAIREWKRVSD